MIGANPRDDVTINAFMKSIAVGSGRRLPVRLGPNIIGAVADMDCVFTAIEGEGHVIMFIYDRPITELHDRIFPQSWCCSCDGRGMCRHIENVYAELTKAIRKGVDML